MKQVVSIILGGGRGTRLMPLTRERAKPSVAFAGQYRLIDIPMSNCINSGIKRIFILTQFLSASLHRHIKQTYQFDRFSNGVVDILSAEQTISGDVWFQGTADAVRATLNHTTYYDSSQTLILSGDHLYRMDYSEFVQFHREKHADITLGVYPVLRSEAHHFGILRTGPDGDVQEFLEKPKDPTQLDRFEPPREFYEARGLDPHPDHVLGSMGVYVFETRVLEDLLCNTTYKDFGKEVIPSALGRYRVAAYPFTGYWRDIGTIRSFYEANIELTRHNPAFHLYAPRWPIHTMVRPLTPSRIIGSQINDSLLGQGTFITGATITNSVVGTRGIVGKGSKLSNVVMLGADFYEGEEVLNPRYHPTGNQPNLGIGQNCQIEGAIIDKNARIGNNVVIRAKDGAADFESPTYWIRDGLTIIPKGAAVPDGTVI